MDDARAPQAPWPDDEFVDYVQARQHTLLRAAYLVCGDLRLAEDLLRAALVELARQWDRVREEQPDLFVRRRLYRDAVASWRHRPPAQLLESPEWLEPDEPWDADVVERRREVLRALGALTPRQHDDADVLGCSVSTAHSEGIEALGRLRDALPRSDIGAGGVR